MGDAAKNAMGAATASYREYKITEWDHPEALTQLKSPVRRNVRWLEYDIADILQATLERLKVT